MRTTWVEKIQQLKRESRWIESDAIHKVYVYPRFLNLTQTNMLGHIIEAKRMTGVPVAISEEVFSDMPEHTAVFLREEYDLSEFWDIYRELSTQERV